MQLTLCDEFDLITLSRFIARLERPFRPPTVRDILTRPSRLSLPPSRLAPADPPERRLPPEPADTPATPFPDPVCWEDFYEQPERWDGLS